MRYRPFGGGGSVVSAIALRVRPRSGQDHDALVSLIHAAFEQGVNYFEIPASDPEILDAVGEAFRPVERDLFIVALRIGGGLGGPVLDGRDFTAQTLANQIVDAQRRTGLRQIDVAVLDDPAAEELSPRALETLKLARSSGRVRMLGVSGTDQAIDTFIETGAFDLLALPFNLGSGWRERRRLIEAQRRDMVLVGYDFWPAQFHHGPRAERPSLLTRALASKPKDPLAGAGSYAFLHNTPGWNSEQICMAYVLSDVSIATVMVDTTSIQRLQNLTAVADREIPLAVSAQVEMARFSAEESA